MYQKQNLIETFGNVIVFLLLILLVLVIALGYKYHSDVQAYQNKINSLNDIIDSKNRIITDKTSQISDYKEQLSTYKKQVSFMDSYAVICPTDGSGIGHKYNCKLLNMSKGFFIYNINNIESQGFDLCSTCYENYTEPSTVEVVYVTNTGSKYHRSWCSYLNSSKKAISKGNAIKQGYTACSRCF